MIERLNGALEGRYRIVRELGQGGMATVYLAADLRHDRKVALKVLKPELAAVVGAERFLAEIKTTANLQHPHILPLFDSGEADGFLFYVMPWVEGESLREKLDREKQLAVDEAVGIAEKMAGALQAAHDQGVIHRDVKPANILLAKGEPLVADFGIALAVQEAGGGRLTETGLSLGTPHYMSPEQATGERDVDARTDVYSLGCVLYEMVTGQPPFQASTAQAVLGRILTGDPEPPTQHRKTIPPHVEATCLRALEKLPADRFASATAFVDALHDPTFRLAAAGEGPRGGAWNRMTTAVAALAVVMAAFALWGWFGAPESTGPVRQYQMILPEGEEIGGWILRIALSPDGSRFVYIHENEQGERELWLRHRDQLHATPIPGTQGAEAPFFSPDGQYVGFFSPRGTIRIVPLEGGPSDRVAETLVGSVGATWSEDGFIYADGQGRTGLVRVRIGGGNPEYFTALDTAAGEADHILPAALPDGAGALFVIKYEDLRSSIAVADAATGAHRVLVEGGSTGPMVQGPQVHPEYALYAAGHLLYELFEGGTLMAQPFEARTKTLRGQAIILAEGLVMGSVGAPDFIPDMTISADGTLMYLAASGGGDSTQVVWVERDGTYRPVDPAWTDQVSQGVALSPDGTRLALDTGDQIWVRDLESGAMTKLTFEGGLRPYWSPDGDEVVFISSRTGIRQAYARNADGTGSARLLIEDARQVHEVGFSPDGDWLVYRVGGGGVADLYARPAAGGDSIPLVETLHQENHASVSPDGRWLAYTSLQSGRPEVWVRPFPDAEAGSWKVSEAGGTEPRWSPRGGELFFRSGNGDLVSVGVADGPTFVFSRPRSLFSADEYDSFVFNPLYSPSPDGQRFIMVRRIREAAPLQPVVIENVFELLKERTGR